MHVLAVTSQTDILQWKELQDTEMGSKSVYNTTGGGRTKA